MKPTSPTTSTLYLMAALTSLALFAWGRGGATANAQSVPSGTTSSQTPGVVGAPQPAAAIVTGTFIVEGNSATVAGVDSARRGYRDDVAQLIAEKFSADPLIKDGAVLVATAYQKSLAASVVPGQDTSSLVLAEGQAGGCALDLVGLPGLQAVSKATHAIYSRTFNTDARMAARQVFLKAATNVVVLSYDPTKCGSN